MRLQDRLIRAVENIYRELEDVGEANLQQTITKKVKNVSIYSNLPDFMIAKTIDRFIQEQNKNRLTDQTQRQTSSPSPSDPSGQSSKSGRHNTQWICNKETNEKLPKIENLVGFTTIINQIRDHLFLSMEHSAIFQKLSISPPRGLLITGPPGSGKTSIALSMCRYANEHYGYKYILPSTTGLIGSLTGESERNIREIFSTAAEQAPSLIFLDELDVITGYKEKASKAMEGRIVSELLYQLDQLPNHVSVIAATSRPEVIDASVRRAGRFDLEIQIPIPQEDQRYEMLVSMTKDQPLALDVDLNYLARSTPGYLPADLANLHRTAGMNAVKRISAAQQSIITEDQMMIEPDNDVYISQGESSNEKQPNLIETSRLHCIASVDNWCLVSSDFDKALNEVQASGLREGFASIPKVTWDDIGGLSQLKDELHWIISMPISQPEDFKKFCINIPAGVLLYGPPGCGKTLLAQAVAHSSSANFISVKGPELLNKYVGESEKAIRQVFNRAKMSAPCIVFFDELDAICPKRGSDNNQVTERIVNTFLAEMDGVDDRRDVHIIGATNRPDIIDKALLRGGRLEKLLYVPLPSQSDRLLILKAHLQNRPLSSDADLSKIAMNHRCEGFSGADLFSLVKVAALNSIKARKQQIDQTELENALLKVFPSVSEQDRLIYEKQDFELKHHG